MLLKLRNVAVRIDGRSILERLSWRVRRGEHWAILGGNGSGKTTLLKTLCGTLFPTEGTISVLSHVFGKADLRNLREHIGWVSAPLLNRIPGNDSVAQVVLSGKRGHIGVWHERFSKGEERQARVLLDRVGLSALKSRAFDTLSQGERQRILIARSLMGRPKLLLLDEPCAHLDPKARAKFLGWLEGLAKQSGGPGLVLVTHHLEEISPMFRKVLLLKKGKGLAQGPREQVLTPKYLKELY